MENELSDSDFNDSPSLLTMTGKEFAYIRKQMKLSQKEFGKFIGKTRGKSYGASTISYWEHQVFMNPGFVREFLDGKPSGLIQSYRFCYKELQEQSKK